MVRDFSAVTLPLAGFDLSRRAGRSSGAIRGEKDQGWGVRATISGLPHPLPASPVEGEVPSGVRGNMEFTHV
jgi:hypothetical protein